MFYAISGISINLSKYANHCSLFKFDLSEYHNDSNVELFSPSQVNVAMVAHGIRPANRSQLGASIRMTLMPIMATSTIQQLTSLLMPQWSYWRISGLLLVIRASYGKCYLI